MILLNQLITNMQYLMLVYLTKIRYSLYQAVTGKAVVIYK